MNGRAPYQSLGAIDLLSVTRDPLLRWTVGLAPALGLLLRFAVPAITDGLEARFGFQLAPYHALVASFLPLFVAATIGTVIGFLLLDQRDDDTLSALLVTPLSLRDYVRYRLVVLLGLSVTLSLISVPLAGLTPTTLPQLALAAVVAAPLAPIYALFLAGFAANKVQGFALVKAAGIVIAPCIAAYFLPGPWQLAFGIVPHYWSLKVFWLFADGRAAAALVHAVLGLGWQALVVMLLVRRFARVVRG